MGGIEEMEGKVKVKVVSECVVYVSFLHMELQTNSDMLPTTYMEEREREKKTHGRILNRVFSTFTSDSPEDMNRHAVHNVTPRPTTTVPTTPRSIASLDGPSPRPKSDTVALLQPPHKRRRVLAAKVPVRRRQVAAFGAVVAPRADDFAVVRGVVFRHAGR